MPLDLKQVETRIKLLREFSDSTCFVPKALDRLEGDLADAGSIVTTTPLGLQQLGREALPSPLFSHTKYRNLQEKRSGRCWI